MSTLSLSRKRRHPDDGKENQEPSKRISIMQMHQRCGKVLSMHLTNFMCHSNLSIEFGERVNFLVGSNGSGKSAILAALVLGLGGKARTTSRSASLKQLIKSNETAAKIEVVLSNSGPQAYDAEVYGDKITIVRNISQSTSTYTIKNENGRVITKKVDDLNRILLYHNIQVDNPVFVLNQDSAREFLKDLEPVKNYKLFLKATQIDLIMDKLNDCYHQNKDQKYRLSCLQIEINKDVEDIADLESRLEMIKSVEDIKNILAKMELMLIWSQVAKKENELEKFQQTISTIHEKKEELQRKSANKESLEKQYLDKIRKHELEIEEISINCKRQNDLYYDAKKLLDSSNERCSEIESSINSMKKGQLHLEKEIMELKKHLKEQDDNQLKQLREHNEETLKEHRETIKGTIAIIESAKQDLKVMYDSKTHKEEQMNEIKHNRDKKRSNLRSLEAQISVLKSSRKNHLSIFGESVALVATEINKYYKAGKFAELPRGPIGSYIQVPNTKYRDVIEQQLSALLTAYVVSNSNDRKILEAIIKKNCPNYNPTIITTKFVNQVYDVQKGCVNPPSNTRLLMHEIMCKDPVVMNILIDRSQVETILITESKTIAEHLTANIESTPKNLTKVVVPNFGLEYHTEPNYSMYSIHIKPARFIQVNVDERIVQMETEKIELQKQIDAHDMELKLMYPSIKSDSERLANTRKLIDEHETNKRELQEKIEELENYEYPEHNEFEVLKKELADMENKLEKKLESLNTKHTELVDLQKQKETRKEEVDMHKNVLSKMEAQSSLHKSQIEEMRLEIRNMGYTFQKNDKKLGEIEDLLKQYELERNEMLEILNAEIKTAQKKGERLDTDKAEEELIDDIKKYKAKLKQRAEITDDPDEVRQQIEEKRQRLHDEKENYKIIKTSLDMLRKSWMLRYDFMNRLKRHMVLLLQFTFNQLLRFRNYVGSIEVNHKAKTMDITVIPRDNHLDSAVSSTRALSGGERSYSTIAFLLALWSCVDHPFYFLDEYDVFTDDVNREYMTKLLIGEGKRRPQRQYSFLTPQDTAIEPMNFIKIHKLADPNRRD